MYGRQPDEPFGACAWCALAAPTGVRQLMHVKRILRCSTGGQRSAAADADSAPSGAGPWKRRLLTASPIRLTAGGSADRRSSAGHLHDPLCSRWPAPRWAANPRRVPGLLLALHAFMLLNMVAPAAGCRRHAAPAWTDPGGAVSGACADRAVIIIAESSWDWLNSRHRSKRPFNLYVALVGTTNQLEAGQTGTHPRCTPAASI